MARALTHAAPASWSCATMLWIQPSMDGAWQHSSQCWTVMAGGGYKLPHSHSSKQISDISKICKSCWFKVECGKYLWYMYRPRTKMFKSKKLSSIALVRLSAVPPLTRDNQGVWWERENELFWWLEMTNQLLPCLYNSVSTCLKVPWTESTRLQKAVCRHKGIGYGIIPAPLIPFVKVSFVLHYKQLQPSRRRYASYDEAKRPLNLSLEHLKTEFCCCFQTQTLEYFHNYPFL